MDGWMHGGVCVLVGIDDSGLFVDVVAAHARVYITHLHTALTITTHNTAPTNTHAYIYIHNQPYTHPPAAEEATGTHTNT
jgi:hypothetical protein